MTDFAPSKLLQMPIFMGMSAQQISGIMQGICLLLKSQSNDNGHLQMLAEQAGRLATPTSTALAALAAFPLIKRIHSGLQSCRQKGNGSLDFQDKQVCYLLMNCAQSKTDTVACPCCATKVCVKAMLDGQGLLNGLNETAQKSETGKDQSGNGTNPVVNSAISNSEIGINNVTGSCNMETEMDEMEEKHQSAIEGTAVWRGCLARYMFVAIAYFVARQSFKNKSVRQMVSEFTSKLNGQSWSKQENKGNSNAKTNTMNNQQDGGGGGMGDVSLDMLAESDGPISSGSNFMSPLKFLYNCVFNKSIAEQIQSIIQTNYAQSNWMKSCPIRSFLVKDSSSNDEGPDNRIFNATKFITECSNTPEMLHAEQASHLYALQVAKPVECKISGKQSTQSRDPVAENRQESCTLAATQNSSQPSTSLEPEFHNMVKKVSNDIPANSLSTSDQLELYGLFKQASNGPCNTSAPSFLNAKALAKWRSWNDKKSLSREDAMKAYISKGNILLQRFQTKSSL